MRVLYLVFLVPLVGCTSPRDRRPPPTTAVSEYPSADLASSNPEAEGMSSGELVGLTTWIRDYPVPIFSLLISRNGRLIYELYTASIDRNDAHYVMSVTKSVLSALIGIAIGQHTLPGPETSITKMLPRGLFASEAEVARLEPLTLKQVMGMGALDAPDPPRKTDPDTLARYQRFWLAPNRVTVALQQPLLSGSFQYNDSTPALAAGALQYGTGKSALDFADEALFSPLGFRNYEWMHQDSVGLDNGGYGLRLRPVDMQKFGILYLNHGVWNHRQIIPKEWVDRSFAPWNRSGPNQERPDYGWFWWTYDFGPGWAAHVAAGWKGQRIAVFPEQKVVVTMTGLIEDGSEDRVFSDIVRKAIMPSVARGHDPQPSDAAANLHDVLDQVHRGPSRMTEFIEDRMVPSVRHKEVRRPFTGR